jgi:NAD(P)H-dependent flavin oxidoreductase YrpB (nitropropane dioxygenase family)
MLVMLKSSMNFDQCDSVISSAFGKKPPRAVYLQPSVRCSSIVASGLDPDALAAGTIDAMKFGSDGSSKSKAWRDIWGSGQGVGAVDRILPAAELVAKLAEEYAVAKARVCT